MLMLSITEFLEARIAEDEAVARAATPSPWTLYDRGVGWEIPELPDYHDGITFIKADAHYVAHNHPSRVLAECAAKRRMLSNIPKTSDEFNPIGGTSEFVLRCLCFPYMNHPDYNHDEWAL